MNTTLTERKLSAWASLIETKADRTPADPIGLRGLPYTRGKNGRVVVQVSRADVRCSSGGQAPRP